MEPQPDQPDDLTAFEETLTPAELEEYRQIRHNRELNDPDFDPATFNAEMAGKFGMPYVGKKDVEREAYNQGMMP